MLSVVVLILLLWWWWRGGCCGCCCCSYGAPGCWCWCCCFWFAPPMFVERYYFLVILYTCKKRTLYLLIEACDCDQIWHLPWHLTRKRKLYFTSLNLCIFVAWHSRMEDYLYTSSDTVEYKRKKKNWWKINIILFKNTSLFVLRALWWSPMHICS